jgi:hypothetical protein
LCCEHLTVCFQEAIDHQNEEPEARVFAFESPSLDAGNSRHEFKYYSCFLGKRQFICVPLATFYDFYKNFKSGRWFYELIAGMKQLNIFKHTLFRW